MLAQFGHSLWWHSPCRDPHCPWHGELLLALQRHSCPTEPSWQQQLGQGDLRHPGSHSLPSPQGPAGLHPMAQVPRARPGPINMAQLLVEGATAHKHTEIPLKRVGEMEERRAGNFRDTWRDRPDLGEKSRHSSVLRAGALLLNPTPKHDN